MGGWGGERPKWRDGRDGLERHVKKAFQALLRAGLCVRGRQELPSVPLEGDCWGKPSPGHIQSKSFHFPS